MQLPLVLLLVLQHLRRVPKKRQLLQPPSHRSGCSARNQGCLA